MARFPLSRALRLARLPLLAFPGYLIASALQASCTAPVDGVRPPPIDTDAGVRGQGNPPGASSCAADETERKLGARDLCCHSFAGFDQQLECYPANGPREGACCPSEGASAQGERIGIELDNCVLESCTGDRTCDEFRRIVDDVVGTMTCTRRPDGTLAWQATGPQKEHVVERACLVVGYQTCDPGRSDDGYVWYVPIDYSPMYLVPQAYCPVPPYGYPGGYYGSPWWITDRKELVVKSACTNGGGPEIGCDVGDL